MGGNQVLGPWKSIGRVLEHPSQPVAPTAHPSHGVLRKYLAGRLSARPERWTQDRAQALVRGELADWTSWDVAAHLAACPKCTALVGRIEHRCSRRAWMSRLRGLVQRPPYARLAWALAGAQALALAAVLIWAGVFRAAPISPKPFTPLPDLGGLSQSGSGALVAAPVRVRFAPSATAGEITKLIESVGGTIFGPGSDGYYQLVLPQGGEAALDTLRGHPVVEDLQPTEER